MYQLLLLFSLCCPIGDAVVPPDPAAPMVHFDTEYLAAVYRDAVRLSASPAHWNEREWKVFIGFFYTGLGLFILDKDIQHRIQDGREDFWAPTYHETAADKVSDWVKPLGDAEKMLIPLGAFYLYGHLAKDDRARSTVLMAVESLLLSNLASVLLKEGFDRERPSGDGVENKWGPPTRSQAGLSFPSGHTVTAFSLATIFAHQYRHRRLVPVTAYTLATLVGLSRVYDNRHWPTDVFIGAALGYYTSRMVLRFHGERNLRVVPTASSDSAGLLFSFTF